MTSTGNVLVVAAGVVCWRRVAGSLEVLVINRGARADTSWPKGKVDPGESLPAAAVRETLEETGLQITLGAPLGVTEYTLPDGRPKIVHYWTAEVGRSAIDAATFTASAEVTSTEWVSVEVALARLSYDRDRDVVGRFTERARQGLLRTFAIIVLRHGKAVPAKTWPGRDSTRPLEQVGLDQARKAARAIVAYRPKKLISSTAARCISTIEPLATVTGLDIRATTAISQDSYEDGEATVRRIVDKRLLRRDTAVLCSHGPVIPEILNQIGVGMGVPRGDELRRASLLATGSFAVVHLPRGRAAAGVVAVEVHGAPDY